MVADVAFVPIFLNYQVSCSTVVPRTFGHMLSRKIQVWFAVVSGSQG